MKTTWLTLVLMLASSQTSAQFAGLYDAEIIDKASISDPAKAMKAADGHWMAFSMPVLAGTRSPCCWKGRWNGMGEVGCVLKPEHESYGTRSDAALTDRVVVLGEIQQDQVQRIRVVGEQCPVDAQGSRVIWVGTVDDTAGMDWLETVASSSDRESAGHGALYALALHRSADAGHRLYSLVLKHDNERSAEAIFWLGEARGEQGLKTLRQLLTELPWGDTRREINFGLAQNNTPEAAALLYEISKSDPDPEQRGEAMFWLAEEYPQQAQAWLLEIVETEQDEDVLEQAVFAISQLPDGSGDQTLLDLARNDEVPRTVRRKALFWLANSDNHDTVAALTELLTR